MPTFNMMGPMFKVLLVLFILCLDQPGFPLCWIAMLSCSTWVMVVLMNNNVEHVLPLCYIYVFNTRSYALIGTWSDHQ
jgi:hypothetical protein